MNGKTLYPVIMVFLFAIGFLAGCPGDPESDGKIFFKTFLAVVLGRGR